MCSPNCGRPDGKLEKEGEALLSSVSSGWTHRLSCRSGFWRTLPPPPLLQGYHGCWRSGEPAWGPGASRARGWDVRCGLFWLAERCVMGWRELFLPWPRRGERSQKLISCSLRPPSPSFGGIPLSWARHRTVGAFSGSFEDLSLT